MADVESEGIGKLEVNSYQMKPLYVNIINKKALNLLLLNTGICVNFLKYIKLTFHYVQFYLCVDHLHIIPKNG